jgi:hypothetical protein
MPMTLVMIGGSGQPRRGRSAAVDAITQDHFPAD